ncbi:MAG TPA: hypothetical protein VJ255_22260, partial [Candidatus Acidoferrum sp.]|nr:hypothetical protein [Candidatus Acidoferrum sp.]
MAGKRKVAFWALGIFFLSGVLVAAGLVVRLNRRHRLPLTLKGAVIKQDSDTQKQSPIANVAVVSVDGLATQNAESDFSGGFSLTMRPGVKMGQHIRLAFRHPDFQPLDLDGPLSSELYVVTMIPLHGEVEAKLNESEIEVGNVRVRYSIATMTTENIGTEVKTFQVVNSANVPCYDKIPCSPDGKWKAEIGSLALDAGQRHF